MTEKNSYHWILFRNWKGNTERVLRPEAATSNIQTESKAYLLSSDWRVMVSIDFTTEWSEGDLKLVINEEGEENKVLYASQTVMKIWSPVFRAMMKDGSFQEGSYKEVKLPGKKHDDILELLKVMHPPNSPITCKFFVCFVLSVYTHVAVTFDYYSLCGSPF